MSAVDPLTLGEVSDDAVHPDYSSTAQAEGVQSEGPRESSTQLQDLVARVTAGSPGQSQRSMPGRRDDG